MSDKKKPELREELKEDIEQHPERGMINGEDVVRFKTIKLQVEIPREMELALLQFGATQGMSKADVVRHALATFNSLPGTIESIKSWQQQRAEKFETDTKAIRNKVYGSYKKLARLRRARLEQ